MVQDEDGYPPVAVESVWAHPVGGADEYVLENVPFFARDATIGDVVLTREDEGGLWFETIVRRSRNSLLRVVFFDRTCVERVNERLVAFGCATEYISTHNLLAVSVPDAVDLGAVQSYLQGEAGAGILDYEEPIISR